MKQEITVADKRAAVEMYDSTCMTWREVADELDLDFHELWAAIEDWHDAPDPPE